VAVAGPGLTVAAADDPSGAGVVPELYDGNPPLGEGGMKIDPPPYLGVNEYEWIIDETTTAHVTVTVYETENGIELDWTSDVPVTKVVVKGGNVGAYIYHYDPALLSDTGLHTPMNPSGAWADLSHVDFYFGEVPPPPPPPLPGSIKVFKFEDINGNGERDEGEGMLAGWEFTLRDAEDAMVASGMTGEDGTLVFPDLVPGAYTVTETLKENWVSTTGVVIDAIVLEDAQTDRWFGNLLPVVEPPETGSIRVYKFGDTNGNGERDEGEDLLPGWEFTLTDAEGTPVDSGVTGEDGTLVFGELLPGDYSVTETLKGGWISTTGVEKDAAVVGGEQASLWFGNLLPVVQPPEGELDLAITKQANRATAGPGDLVKYTLTYRNLGETPAEDFTIVDDFDERYVTVVDAAGGVVAGGTITWTLAGPLSEADGPKTIEYTVRVNTMMPAGTTNIDNIVTISHPDDIDLTNNSDTERVSVTLEAFLPFTGGESLGLVLIALATAVAGLILRRSGAVNA
jgi:uncharacterized repeat protein (TIGR01451 family)